MENIDTWVMWLVVTGTTVFNVYRVSHAYKEHKKAKKNLADFDKFFEREHKIPEAEDAEYEIIESKIN